MQPKSEDCLGETFEDVEKLYYKLHYTDFVEKQNARNAKTRHTERNRSIEDLLTSKKTCPEETIYQLGTLENHASPKELFQVVTEFVEELDWLESPERKADRKTLDYTIHQFATLRKHVLAAVKKLTAGLTNSLSTPEVKKPALEKIKEEARPSVLQKLQQRQEALVQREQNRTKPKKRSHGMEL